MDVKFLNQPKEVKVGEILKKRLNEDFDNMYLVAGVAKDTGFEDVMEDLEDAAKRYNKIEIYVGIDRKNTSKDMLLKILSIGCEMHVHINTDDSKVETRAIIFENPKGISYIYIFTSKFSTGGLFENDGLVTEFTYTSQDDKKFQGDLRSIMQGIKTSFEKVDKDDIILLAEKGDIVARITDRKIPKISEMYGSAEQSVGEQIYDESISTVAIDFDNLAEVDIDFDTEISVRKNVELESEKEAKKEQQEREKQLKSLKKTKEDLERLYTKPVEEKGSKAKAVIHISDEIEYSKMTALLLEANKIVEKGLGAGEIKIPKSLADNVIEFLGGVDSFEGMVDEKGNTKNIHKVKFDILDNRDNQKFEDENAKLIRSDKGISILSDELISLNIEEGDIIRLIKEKNYFTCEIIRKDTAEYSIWSMYLVNTIKGHKRKFGII